MIGHLIILLSAGPLVRLHLLAQTTQAEDPISKGIKITFVGITIVFVALILISLFIASLPRILEQVAGIWPEVEDRHAMSREGHPESLVPEEGRVIAAIGFVLHTEMQRQLAAERAAGGKQ